MVDWKCRVKRSESYRRVFGNGLAGHDEMAFGWGGKDLFMIRDQAKEIGQPDAFPPRACWIITAFSLLTLNQSMTCHIRLKGDCPDVVTEASMPLKRIQLGDDYWPWFRDLQIVNNLETSTTTTNMASFCVNASGIMKCSTTVDIHGRVTTTGPPSREIQQEMDWMRRDIGKRILVRWPSTCVVCCSENLQLRKKF